MSFLCYTVGPCCWSVLNIIAKPAFLIAIVDGVSFHLIIYFLISYLLRSRERESIWVNRVERYVESFSLLSLSWIFSFCLESVTMTFLIILYSLCVCVCVCVCVVSFCEKYLNWDFYFWIVCLLSFSCRTLANVAGFIIHRHFSIPFCIWTSEMDHKLFFFYYFKWCTPQSFLFCFCIKESMYLAKIWF